MKVVENRLSLSNKRFHKIILSTLTYFCRFIGKVMFLFFQCSKKILIILLLVYSLFFNNKVKNNVPNYNTFFGCLVMLSLSRAVRLCYGTPISISTPYPLNLHNKSVQGIRESSITYVV